MRKPKVINLEGVRRADARLQRAKELDPNVTTRPVPVGELVAIGRVTLTVPELAALTGLHPLTIRRAIGNGELKAANGGGRSHYRISRADAEAWWRGRGGGTLLGDATINTTTGEAKPGDVPEQTTGTVTEQAEALWRELTSGDNQRHRAASAAVGQAPEAVRAIIVRRSAEAAAAYNAKPKDRAG
jgi:excisionase family DNA binding protein